MELAKSLCLFTFITLAYCGGTAASPQSHITPAQAKDHVGKSVTVCGIVASTKYATTAKKSPTFLNLDEPYPRQIFTVVIWETDRGKFGQPEVGLKNKNICVTGTVQLYRGKPEIILKDKSQLNVE